MGSGCAWRRICAAWRRSRSPNDRIVDPVAATAYGSKSGGKVVVAPLKRRRSCVARSRTSGSHWNLRIVAIIVGLRGVGAPRAVAASALHDVDG